ncbi:MAG: lysophospholipid acyltransferase family protein [Planctomycetes bacterium]|nr:lysophospholipid acyltransferase family protein [Planctomycetota bacterium]
MRIRSRWLTWTAATIVVGIGKLLFATCRKVYIGTNEKTKLNYIPGPDDGDRYVLCVWHDALLVPTFAAPRGLRQKTCCLVSQHQDGSYLANAMALLGYSTVRGSSRRGGAQAVRQLLDDTAGLHIVITPDGPGGPRQKLKAGAIFVASQLGRRIVPSAYSATRYWRKQGSWTDMLIPKPFSTVYVAMGTPIDIPLNLPRDQMDHYIDLVQHAMDRLTAEMEAVARGESPLVEPPSQLRSAA